MIQEYKDKWIEFLRNPEYKQGNYFLRLDTNKVPCYCALGLLVLAVDSSLFVRSNTVDFELGDKTEVYGLMPPGAYKPYLYSLPSSFLQKCGLPVDCAQVLVKYKNELVTISYLSDSVLKFPEIAEVVEESL